MEVKQVYQFVNTATQQALGESAIAVAEDLSNIVDVGNAIINANAVDNYVRSLSDHIGRVIFVDRVYRGIAPTVLMDGWEYGSILEKIAAGLPEAQENESWELNNGTSYDPNIFTKPAVSVKFFDKRVTFEVPLSITRKQVKSSFSNAAQLNGFISMLYNAVEKSMTVKLDSLVQRTINNMIAETAYADYEGAAFNTKSGVRAINLLNLYNTLKDASLTPAQAMGDPDFIRFAAYNIKLYADRLSALSTIFNVGGEPRFTPRDRLKIVMLSDFASAADVYLQSDTFHNELTALPAADRIPYWQGTGTSWGFADVSQINVKTAGSGQAVNLTGIICVMFDRDALGVTNMDRRVESNWNGRAEFWNYWYKMDAGYFNDLNENFLVFFVA